MDPNEAARRLTEISDEKRPRDEQGYVAYIEELLKGAGIPTGIIAPDPSRPCLYAKITKSSDSKSSGSKSSEGLSPLLLYGKASLTQPEGGPVGIRVGAALFVTTMLKIKALRKRLPFDLLLLITCSSPGESGLGYVAEKYPKLFTGVKYALNDTGGFPVVLGQKKLHPITVAERQAARFRVTARGKMGLARIVQGALKLEKKSLSVRITEPVRRMANDFGRALGETDEIMFRFMQRPFFTRKVVSFIGANKQFFEPLLANEAKVVGIHGLNEANPGEMPDSAFIEIEARILPDVSIKEGMADIRRVIGPGYEIEVLAGSDTPPVDMALYDSMAEVLKSRSPGALPVPFVSKDMTDARFLTKLGIQSYGFAPIDCLGSYSFFEIPRAGGQASADALSSGAQTLLDFLLSLR